MNKGARHDLFEFRRKYCHKENVLDALDQRCGKKTDTLAVVRVQR